MEGKFKKIGEKFIKLQIIIHSYLLKIYGNKIQKKMAKNLKYKKTSACL